MNEIPIFPKKTRKRQPKIRTYLPEITSFPEQKENVVIDLPMSETLPIPKKTRKRQPKIRTYLPEEKETAILSYNPNK